MDRLILASLGLCLLQPVQTDPGGTLVTPRSDHTATLLADGRMLLAGGYDGALAATASSEIYNPATNTWTATGNLNQGRRNQGTVLLCDGRALSMGGSTTGDVSTVTNSAEIYNPATGLWSVTANMITARSYFDPVLLANGKVLVAGGHIAGFPFETASCELYDPVTGTWSPTGALLQPRTQYHATLLADGRALVTGGNNQTAGLIAQSELYDPATGTWTSSGSLTLPRDRNVQVRLADGRVLVAGGIKEFGFESHPPKITASAEIYDPITGIWSPTGSLNTPRIDFTANLLNDGRIFVAGGWDIGATGGIPQTYSSIEEYSPSFGKWRTLANSLASARFDHTATKLLDGSLIIAGGMGYAAHLIPTAELFVRPR
jgi:large repetitive protein